jgi:hypothetical protein
MSKLVLAFAALTSLALVSTARADLPDVTLAPWTVRNISVYLSSFSFTSTDGLVLVYGNADAQVSNNFGLSWSAFHTGSRLANYIDSQSTAYKGNGYFALLNGLVNIRGTSFVSEYDMAYGNLLMGIETYTTHTSSNDGATWTTYLNPFSEDNVKLISFNRVFHDGTSFVAVAANSNYGYGAFGGSTWRSNDGISWYRILDSDAVCMDSQGRLVVAKAGAIYDLVGNELVFAHMEFPTAHGAIDYHRVDGRIYRVNGDLLYYSDDKGITKYRTGFPNLISVIWTRPDKNGRHVVQVALGNRIFSSVPVSPMLVASKGMKLDIEVIPQQGQSPARAELTFEAPLGTTVLLQSSPTPAGPWTQAARVTAVGTKQTWDDNRDLNKVLFYRAGSL